MSTTSVGELLCERHPTSVSCRFCLRTFEGGDGRTCESCRSSRLTPDVITLGQGRVLSWLERFFPGHQLAKVDLRCEPANRFPEFCYGESLVSFDGSRTSVSIRVPLDLPEFYFAEVLVHEYGHVLLAVDPTTYEYLGEPALSDELQEGFCEVLRWHWAVDAGEADLQFRARSLTGNGADTYRIGFGRVRSMLQAARTVQQLRLDLLASGTGLHPSATPAG